MGILEKEQSLSDTPRHFVKRSAAKYLEAQHLAQKLGKNLYRMLIAVRKGIADPVGEIVRRWKHSDGGGLLPPLAFYMPFIDPPEWLLRCYR